MKFYKTYLTMFTVILTVASATGSAYVLVKRYMIKKSYNADNKLKYISFNSEDDDFLMDKSA